LYDVLREFVGQQVDAGGGGGAVGADDDRTVGKGRAGVLVHGVTPLSVRPKGFSAVRAG
jgi:hypothetical protein